MKKMLRTFKIIMNKKKTKTMVCVKPQNLIAAVYLDNHKRDVVEGLPYLKK